MSGWVEFEGRIETMEWGRAVFAILRLPEEAVTALSGARRVEGEFGEHPMNLAISRAPVVKGAFLWTGQSLMDRTGLRPGEVVEVRLRPAPVHAVDTPPTWRRRWTARRKSCLRVATVIVTGAIAQSSVSIPAQDCSARY